MSISGNSVLLANATLAFLLAAAAPLRLPAWQPAEQSPAPRTETGHVLAFPCRFTPLNDRCVWDGPVPPGLDPAGRLEIQLSCDTPAALRGLTLYLRHDQGWLAAPLPVPGAEPRSFSLAAGDFTSDSGPVDWSRITGIRLAAWKRGDFTGDSVLRLHRLSAFRDRVFVIQAVRSAPAGEQAIAQTLALRLSGWLREAGIGHALVTDETWLALAPGQTRFAILPYNPRPDPDTLKALDACIRAGGKILVCYGASPDLAARLGFRLAPYRAAPSPVTWSGFRFDPPVGPVGTVFQNSLHLIPAQPAGPDARVLAWWQGPAGERRPEAAWLASPSGYWMTHVLDNEDAPLKTRLLLEWIGAHAPEAWQQAAQYALDHLPADIPETDRARLHALAERRDWKTLLDEAGRLRTDHAYRLAGRLPAPRAGEPFAVWAQPGPGFLPDDWPQVAPALRRAGVNRLYFAAASFGQAHYDGGPFARSEAASFARDPFGAAVRAAAAHGIAPHAWITCFNVAYAPAARLAAWRLAGRLIQTPAGEQPWLSPAHPENVQLLLELVTDILARYPVAGIHLDYVRMPGEGLDISPAARRGFEAAHGASADWPAEVLAGGARHTLYKDWLAGTIESFVRAARERAHALKPGIVVSAAVFPAYPYCRDGLLQDWKKWLATDAVDEICTMSYTASLPEFQGWLNDYRTLPGWGTRILPGLGLYADTATLDPETLLAQIRELRLAGAAGTVLFLANRPFLRDIAPLLAAAPVTPTSPSNAVSGAAASESRNPAGE